MSKTLLISILSGLLFACKSHKNITDGSTPKDENIILFGVIGDMNRASDPITIENATLKGNVLEISVSYSGGCQKHHFSLIGSAAISKSLPPRRAIKLIHEKMGDDCKKSVQEKLYFNIDEFSYTKESGSTIFLDLNGYGNAIEFIKE